MSKRILAIDVETFGDPNTDEALDFSRCGFRLMGYYNPTEHGAFGDIDELKTFLEKELKRGTQFIFHNSKFDQKVLFRITGIWVPCYFDTLLAAALLPDNPHRLKLDILTPHYLGLPSYKEAELLTNMGEVSFDTCKDYCIKDCKTTYQLAKVLWTKLRENGLLGFYRKHILPFADMLGHAEYRGIMVDAVELNKQWQEGLAIQTKLLEDLTSRYSDLIQPYVDKQIQTAVQKYKTAVSEERRAKLRKKHQFNWHAPGQCLWLLKDCLKLPCINSKKRPSSDNEVLTRLQDKHPVVKDILQLRKLKKSIEFYETWTQCLREDGSIMGTNNLDIARTGRISMSKPNLLQVPSTDHGPHRRVMVARDGYTFVDIDYKQIEPRIVAHYSKDPRLLAAFTPGAADFYSIVVKGLLGLSQDPKEIMDTMPTVRAFGKRAALAILYGMQPAALAKTIYLSFNKKISYFQADEMIQAYFNAFPLLAQLRKDLQQSAVDNGYITNLFGRKLYIRGDDIYHKVLNTLIQGSASDLNNTAHTKLYQLCKAQSLDAHILLLPYDEGLWEVNIKHVETFVALAKPTLTEGWGLRVPLDLDIVIGPNWGCNA